MSKTDRYDVRMDRKKRVEAQIAKWRAKGKSDASIRLKLEILALKTVPQSHWQNALLAATKDLPVYRPQEEKRP